MKILLMYSTHVPTNGHVERLGKIQPSSSVIVAKDEEHAIESAKDADIIFGHRYLRQCMPFTERLQWIQSTAGGVDRLPLEEILRKSVILTRMTIFAPIIARHAETLAWSITRCLPDAWQKQQVGKWDYQFEWLPWPRRAIIFGVGSIGRSLALRLNASGIAVIAVRQRMSDETIPGVNQLCDPSSWREELPHVDWCFLALPHTTKTFRMFDDAALRALPKHAILVNIGRGETLDTVALCRVLKQGHLGGAALDVMHPKPTGLDDPVWHTPRLIITPHVSAHHMEHSDAIEHFCEAQLSRYVTGQELRGLAELKTSVEKN